MGCRHSAVRSRSDPWATRGRLRPHARTAGRASAKLRDEVSNHAARKAKPKYDTRRVLDGLVCHRAPPQQRRSSLWRDRCGGRERATDELGTNCAATCQHDNTYTYNTSHAAHDERPAIGVTGTEPKHNTLDGITGNRKRDVLAVYGRARQSPPHKHHNNASAYGFQSRWPAGACPTPRTGCRWSAPCRRS